MKTGPATMFALFFVAAGIAAAEVPGSKCSEVAAMRMQGLVITSAHHEEGSAASAKPEPSRSAALTGGAASSVKGGYCVVEGMLDQHSSADGQKFGIGFELRLPDQWTQRFLYQGGGGMDGFIAPAVGPVPVRESTAPNALSRGFAVVSTDSGHKDRSGKGIDASFATDQIARLDNGYRAIGRLTRAVKQIIASYYGEPARYSYIMGCSNGGRQGLIAAQRFPDEFDGVVSGAPAYRVTVASLDSAWDVQALTAVAPKNAQGAPILSEALTDADLKLLSGSILNACDAKDGLKDGLIDDYKDCHYSPEVLQCRAGKNSECLTLEQVKAVKAVFSELKDGHGDTVYAAWPYDAGVSAAGWRAWKLGSSKTAEPNALNATLMKAALGGYFFSPPDPTFDQLHFDLDSAIARIQETHAMQDATWTQLSDFYGHGGKLLIFHGLSDPIFSALDTVQYFDKLTHDNGGQSSVKPWARLFLVPGMNHCGDGPALDDFDPLTAIVDWVETGAAPVQLPAKGPSFPGRTRPLCAYPEIPRYKGNGSTDDASNFSCK